MSDKKRTRVCPVERAGILDVSLRRLVQNPKRILQPYVREGMTVLDLGCGPGFFTLEMARLVGGEGRVIAADLQEGMLDIIRGKIAASGLNEVVQLHRCSTLAIGISSKCDFVLLFYMLHEVPDQAAYLNEIKAILQPGGKVLIVEPAFHISRKGFQESITLMKQAGYRLLEEPKIRFSRAVLIQ